MIGWQRMVREFHNRFGQPVVDKPRIPGIERQALRERLIGEEYLETINAMDEDNIFEVADGLADLIYVALGTAIEYGIDLEPVFREVHRSNMSKTPGNQRSDGKILKGPGFSPPDIASILAEQSK